jgi:hypothetical protein
MSTWSLTGNVLGTPPSGFLGTTDNNALVIKTGSPTTERLRVDTSGKVGIGTTSPAATLDLGSGLLRVGGTTTPMTTEQGAYLGWNALTGGTGETDFINNQGLGIGGFAFMNTPPSGSPRTTLMVITGSGNVGIGTSTPAFPLHLAAGKTLRIEGGTSPADNADYFSLGGNGSFGIDAPGIPNGRFVVQNSGNVGIGTPSPTSTLQVNGSLAVTGSGFLTVSGEYNNPRGTTNFNYSVDIGVGAPSWVLQVSAPVASALGPVLALTNPAGGVNAAAAIDFYTHDPGEGAGPDHVTSPTSEIKALDDGNYGNHIVFLSTQPGAANNPFIERMRITSTGNVNVPGDIVLTGADCAEQFDVSSSEPPQPGTVVVIDEGGGLRESHDAYDKKVAGVVSGAGDYRHAILLDRRIESEQRVAVALVGKVFCKVDAEYSPVQVGDLLTTSATPGHAMKATEAGRAFGSVIGKALRSLEAGRGMIPILVALQ